MRALLLASTALALSAGIAAAQTAITPGSGSLTDAGGNVWLITPDGSVQENGQWTPGGGGTAALAIVNGTVYGLDATGKGWFTLSGSSRYWSASAAPAGMTVPSAQASATPSRAAAQTVPIGSSAQTTAPARQTTTASSTSTSAATAPPVTTCAATAGGAASSGFTTSNGNILAPDGSVFIAKGIDIMEGDEPSVSTLKADFPGINFVRFAVYDEAGASTLSPWVTSLTSAGIVVEIEHHIAAGGGVPALTGSALTAENNWFQGLATAFKSNPYVWFGTVNEPASGGGLGAEQSSNYQTIRAAGNNTIIMISAPVEAANVSSMTGVVDDHHYYGWNSGYSTNQTTVTNDLMQMISTDQQQMTATGKIPVIIGEYGNSTNGTSIDANWQQVLTAVQSSGYGSAAWAWLSGGGDALLSGGNSLSSYGQEVAGYIELVSGAPASIWSASCNGAPVTTAASPAAASAASGAKAANVAVASAGTSGTADTSQQTAAAAATPDTTALDSTAAAQADASNAAIAAADAQAPAVAAAVQQANTAGARANAGLAGVLATMGGGQ
jgi:hypothetical protein